MGLGGRSAGQIPTENVGMLKVAATEKKRA
jgi:hypothetical protein